MLVKSKKMYGYIYETTNDINGKKYIGQSRGKFKSFYFGSGKLIKQAVKKYGKENFTIKVLKYASTKKELNKLEKELIDKTNAIQSEKFYNLHEGGIGGDTFSGKSHTTKAKRKMSKSKKGRPTGRKGAFGKWDKETNNRRSKAMKEWRKNNKKTFNKTFVKKFHKKWKKYYGVIIDGVEYPSLSNASEKLGIPVSKLTKQKNVIYTGSKWKK